jgi:hypothetical protein
MMMTVAPSLHLALASFLSTPARHQFASFCACQVSTQSFIIHTPHAYCSKQGKKCRRYLKLERYSGWAEGRRGRMGASPRASVSVAFLGKFICKVGATDKTVSTSNGLPKALEVVERQSKTRVHTAKRVERGHTTSVLDVVILLRGHGFHTWNNCGCCLTPTRLLRFCNFIQDLLM